MKHRPKNSRREFIKLLSMAPVGTVLFNACSSTPEAVPNTSPDLANDSSTDIGTNQNDMGTVNPDVGVADQSANPDVGPDGSVGDAGDLGSEDMGNEVCEATGSDVEGPFHEDGAPERTNLAAANEPGTRLIVEGRVLDENCVPIAGAWLDVWHADTEGDYHGAEDEYRLRGQMQANDDGYYRFESIMPGRYPLGNSTRPAHVHFIVSRPGFVPLTTQLYFEGDPFLNPNDPCGNGCNSGDETLIVPLGQDPNGIDLAVFDIVLRRA